MVGHIQRDENLHERFCANFARGFKSLDGGLGYTAQRGQRCASQSAAQPQLLATMA